MTTIVAGYGAYFLVSKYFIPHQQTIDRNPRQIGNPDISVSQALIDNGAGWWESKGLIYHGIPARILFFLPSSDRFHADGINAAAWQEFDRIGRIFNPFDPASEIARLNDTSRSRRPPIQLTVSQDVYTVMMMSRDLWAQSSGNFDPTVWSVKQLWQDAEKNQRVPSEQDIATALRSTGFGKVRLMDDIKYRICIEDHPVMFDFGGIVKGYAVDQVRRVLSDKGVTAGLVQLGGEIATFGNNGDDPWRLGIQHPTQMDKVWGVIEGQGSLRVSTSGNYRQAIRIRDQSFYHIFSPKTGRPVSEKVLGVTTACMGEKTSSARLDGIATAITVMGPSAGLRLAETTGVDAVILYETSDGTIGELATQGLDSHYSRDDK
ncbi:MAG: FAD:protein FMN transferase [Desulfosalsimonadaceae bacterium]